MPLNLVYDWWLTSHPQKKTFSTLRSILFKMENIGKVFFRCAQFLFVAPTKGRRHKHNEND